MHRVVVKIGTNVITKPDGFLDEEVMHNLVSQIITLKKQKVEVIVISSGAVAAGRRYITPEKLPKNAVARRQILAAVGQVELMGIYGNLFRKEGYQSAQVLATKEDFRDRRHYLCMRDCLQVMLCDEIIPIINENDVVAITELMFTDNDELAGLVASMLCVDSLFILSSVDGLYDRNPDEEGAQLIQIVDEQSGDLGRYAAASAPKSTFGRGGMHTKCRVAKKMSTLGIATYFANGKKEGILLDLFEGKSCGTYFPPAKKPKALKQWIAQGAGHEKGTIFVNLCAAEILQKKNSAISLLPVGVTEVKGHWSKGDLLCIRGPKKEVIGFGIAQYGYQAASESMGKKGCRPLIHYDYLYITPEGT